MKLKSILQLYSKKYPQAVAQRITIAEDGSIEISDSRRKARFAVNMGRVLQGRALPESEAADGGERLLTDEFIADNRRELFMMGETRCLYGIVYAENITTDLRFMAIEKTGTPPMAYADGIRLTWLFALADKMTHNRYSLSSVTLERSGEVVLNAHYFNSTLSMRVIPAGVILLPDGSVYKSLTCDDDDALRYACLFCRDNARWFAAFAAGEENSL